MRDEKEERKKEEQNFHWKGTAGKEMSFEVPSEKMPSCASISVRVVGECVVGNEAVTVCVCVWHIVPFWGERGDGEKRFGDGGIWRRRKVNVGRSLIRYGSVV